MAVDPAAFPALFEPRGVLVAGVSTHPGKFGFVSPPQHPRLRLPGRGATARAARPGEVLGVPVVADIDDLPDDAHRPRVRVHPGVGQPRPAARLRQEGHPRRLPRVGRLRRGGRGGPAAPGRAGRAGRRARDARRRSERPGRRVHARVRCAPRSWRRTRRPAAIGIASQSGNFISSFMNYAVQTGVGVSRAVSAGNAAAVTIPDYLDFYAQRRRHRGRRWPTSRACPTAAAFFERTRAVAGREAARAREGRRHRRRPAGRRRHTGSLASDDRVFDGMCRQAGITRAATIEEAFEAAATFATQPLPKGNRVVVMTTAGGWGVVTADAITPLVARAHAAARRPARRARREAPAALEPQQPRRPGRRRDPRHHPRGARPHRRPPRRRRGDLPRASGIQSNQAALMRSGPLLPGPRPRADRRLPRAPGRPLRRRPPPRCRTATASRCSPPPSWPSPTRTTPDRPRSAPRGRALLPDRQPRGHRPRPPLALRPPPEGPRPDVRHPRWWLLLAVPAVVLLVGAAMAQRDASDETPPAVERWRRHPRRHDHVCRAAACVAVHDHPARRPCASRTTSRRSRRGSRPTPASWWRRPGSASATGRRCPSSRVDA